MISCLNIAQTLYSRGAEGTNAQFLEHFITKVVPVLHLVSEKNRLLLLKAVADASAFASADMAARALRVVYDLIKVHVPASDAAVSVASPVAAPVAASEVETKSIPPIAPISQTAAVKINFSVVECLLITFHYLASKAPSALRDVAGIFTPTGQPSDFRAGLREKREILTTRLEFLKTNLSGYIAQVKAVDAKLQEKLKECKDAAEKKVQHEKRQSVQVALATTRNIERLTAALVAKPSQILGSNAVTPSWRPRKAGAQAEAKGVDNKKR